MNHKRQINRFYQGSGNFEQSKLVNNDVQIYKVTLKVRTFPGTWKILNYTGNIEKVIIDGKEALIQQNYTFENDGYSIFKIYFKSKDALSHGINSSSPKSVFYNTPFIEEIYVHQGFTQIQGEFNQLVKLRKITFGNTIRVVDSCFFKSLRLEEVIFEENSVLERFTNIFGNSGNGGNNNLILKIPDSCKQLGSIYDTTYVKDIQISKNSKIENNLYFPVHYNGNITIPKKSSRVTSYTRFKQIDDYSDHPSNSSRAIKYNYLGNSNTINIGDYAQIVRLNNNVNTINLGRNNLADLEIPKSVTSINGKDSQNFAHLIIPNTVKNIQPGFCNSISDYGPGGIININSETVFMDTLSGFQVIELGRDTRQIVSVNSTYHANTSDSSDNINQWTSLIIPKDSKLTLLQGGWNSATAFYFPDSLKVISGQNNYQFNTYYGNSSAFETPGSIYFPKNIESLNINLNILSPRDYDDLEHTRIIVFNSIPFINSIYIPNVYDKKGKIYIPENAFESEEKEIEWKSKLVGTFEDKNDLDAFFDTFVWDNDVQYSSDRKVLLRCNRNSRSFTIPNTVTRIISTAFPWQNNLEVVNIPASVQAIDPAAFYCCKNIKKFNVDPDNEYFCSVNGILYTKDMTELVCYPPAKDSTVYEVPETVTYLRHMSLYWCKNIKKFKVSSVKYISSGVIHRMENIEELDFYFPKGTSNYRPQFYSEFAKSQHLRKISIQAEDTFIPCNSQFILCPNLEEVYIKANKLNSVEPYDGDFIQTGASFIGCDKLNSVIIDAIGSDNYLVGCPAKNVTVQSLSNISHNMFAENVHVTKYFNTNYLYATNLKQIISDVDTDLNYFCYSVSPNIKIKGNKDISISGSWNAVNGFEFPDDYSGNITLNGGFCGKEITIPDGTKQFTAFIICPYLDKVNISKDSQLTTLSYDPIGYNSYTEYLFIPKFVDNLQIGSNMSILNLEVDPENTNFRMIGDFLLNSEGKVKWIRPGITETVVPKEVKELTISNLNVTFEENSQLTNLYISNYSGESLTVPESVTSLSISNCPNLNNINFDENLTSLGVDNCPKLNTINLNEGLTTLSINSCSVLNNVNFHEGLISLTTRNCPELDVIVPESVTSYTIGNCKSVEFKNMIPFGKKTTSNPTSNNQIKITDGTVIKVPSCTIDEWKTQLEYDGITVGSECYSKETEDGTVCEDGKEYTNIRKEISKDDVNYTYLRNYRSNLISEDSENCPHIVMPSGATNLGNDKYRIPINSTTQSFTINTSDKIDSLNMDWTVVNSSQYGSVQGTIEYKIDDGEYTSISFRDKNSETISNLGGSSHVITVQIKRASNNYDTGLMIISFTK